MNAAKALMFMSHRPAAGPIARMLAASKGEAAYGYFGKFMYKTAKQDQAEYNDPPPRWREAMVRALGALGGGAHAKLLIRLLNDETSVLEVRHAAAGGATIVGPGRYRHTVLPRDRNMAVTSPFPLGSGKVLCAATVRHRKRKDVDLALYVMDAATGKLTLLYNDPQTADFEARPRQVPAHRRRVHLPRKVLEQGHPHRRR